MTHPTCNTCFWFEALKEQCRRYPPQAVTVLTASGPKLAGTFPTTFSENWCGEHRPEQPLEN